MRRHSVIVLILSAILLFCVKASADGPVDPSMSEMREQLTLIETLISERSQEKDTYNRKAVYDAYGDVSITMSKNNPKPTDTVAFSANVTGVSSDITLEYKWSIQDVNRDSGGYLYWPQHNDEELSQKSISYKFFSSGKYRCSLIVYKKNSSEQVGFDYITFTIEDDGIHPSLEQKAEEIVNQYLALPEWQRALKLYDWLTQHAFYDDTRCFHGADIIFLGYGVCDSYSKAYMLLCQTAGITVERTFGPNHAWNALVLDGKWYQADVTWDDPGTAKPGEGELISGQEGHRFFCLSSEIMQNAGYNHLLESGAHAKDCISMEANYFIHENLWQRWGNRNGNSVSTWVNQVQNTLNNNQAVFETSVSNPNYQYYSDNDGKINYDYFSYSVIVKGILEHGLSHNEFKIGNDPVKVKTSCYGDNNLVICARLTGWDIKETGTLMMPKNLSTIPSSAFEGTKATTVTIQPDCTSIESRAFANSGLRTITIPRSVVSIASDAFSGCGKIIVIAENGSTAMMYASGKNMIVIDPADVKQ